METETEKKTGRLHYAWIIAIACFFIAGGGYGITINSRGIFFSSIMEELNVNYSQLLVFTFTFGIGSLIITPLVPILFKKLDSRILFGTCAVILSTTQFAQGLFNHLWQFYISGCLQGIAYTLLLPMGLSLIINNWFVKHRGLVLGLVGAASGLVGALSNHFCNIIIETQGYRTAYIIMGIALFILLVPSCFIILRLNPDEKGLKPYGYVEKTGTVAEKKGIQISEARKMPELYIIVTAMAISGFVTCIPQFLKDYGVSVGFTAIVAGDLTVASMLGNMVAKVLLGRLDDKKGIYFALNINTIGFLAGLVMIMNTRTIVDACIGSALVGLPLAANVVLFPSWTIHTFGDKDYTSIYAIIALSMNVSNSVGFLIYSFIYDSTQSYMTMLWVTVAVTVIWLLLIFLCKALRKHRKATI